MRNSLKLGVFTALCASVAFVGCGDDDDSSPSSAGSTNKAGASSSAGLSGLGGGSSAGNASGGTASAGKGGTTSGGTTSGGTTSGGVATGGTSAGSGGASAGTAGTSAGTSGSSSGGTLAGGDAGASSGGSSSAGDNGLGGECSGYDDSTAAAGQGSGGAPSFTSAVVLFDSVVVKDAANAAYKDWQFATAADIADVTTHPGDKWSRPPYDPGSLGNDAAAHDTFVACDGEPGLGSLKNVVPFSDANQYYELAVPFAEHDLSSYTVTAKAKLVSGGRSDPTCAVRAELYVNGATGSHAGPALALSQGEWVTLSFTVPATGATQDDQLGLRLNTYPCQ
jgi:hypothetical protein